MKRILWKNTVVLSLLFLNPAFAVIEDENQIEERVPLQRYYGQNELLPLSAHMPVTSGVIRQEDWTDKIVRWCVFSGFLRLCGCIEVKEHHSDAQKHKHLE